MWEPTPTVSLPQATVGPLEREIQLNYIVVCLLNYRYTVCLYFNTDILYYAHS